MDKKVYEKPMLLILSDEDLESYSRDSSHCSGCGGKCHRGSN